MAQDLAALTNTWMLNPYMFDPSQQSNAYSNYNNQALPWPPTYGGTPVNAATGKPIQSFQDWQAANPGGMSINSTPQQPAAPQQSSPPLYGPASAVNPQSGLTPQRGNVPMPGGNQFMSQQGYQALYGGGGMPQQPGPQAGAQAGGASAPPNNWQAALSALANPGNPVTQGATVPMVSGSQPAGGVNAAFLQQAGQGQGMNQNFLNALRSIQARPQQ